MRASIATAAAFAAVFAPAAAAAPTTLHLSEQHTFQHTLDKGKKGESAGDVHVFGGPVSNAAGHRVGHDRISCVVGSTCDVTIWLAGGTIVARHVAVTPPRFDAAITSGTGSYAGTKGIAHVVLGAVSRYTIRLTR